MNYYNCNLRLIVEAAWVYLEERERHRVTSPQFSYSIRRPNAFCVWYRSGISMVDADLESPRTCTDCSSSLTFQSLHRLLLLLDSSKLLMIDLFVVWVHYCVLIFRSLFVAIKLKEKIINLNLNLNFNIPLFKFTSFSAFLSLIRISLISFSRSWSLRVFWYV